jgi:RNA polymerase sigma-70 factor (ECF subfamily)
MLESECDKTLVEQAAKGDGESFTELCRRYYGAMVAIGHAILRDRHLAEDAAQQAFAKAAVNLPKLRRAGQFGTWLAAICRNAAIDIVRRRPPPAPSEGLLDVEDQSPRDEVTEAVKGVLKELPAEAREVVYLRFYDGLTYEQMSAVLGISEQAINGRLRRAKKELAKYLHRQGFDEA